MEIYLVRHGIAEDSGPDGRDASRRLTGDGKKKTARVAEVLRSRVKDLGVIYHSPFVRAVETAGIFAAEFPGVPLKEVSFLTPYDPPEKALPLLLESEPYRTVMLVGHEPYMSGLATLLLTGRTSPGIVEFKKAGVAAIQWRGPREAGRLQFLISPKLL